MAKPITFLARIPFAMGFAALNPSYELSFEFDAQRRRDLGRLPSPLWGGVGVGVVVVGHTSCNNYDPHPARLRFASAVLPSPQGGG